VRKFAMQTALKGVSILVPPHTWPPKAALPLHTGQNIPHRVKRGDKDGAGSRIYNREHEN